MVEEARMMTLSMVDAAAPTGLWTSPDGDVRKLLLPNGRYLVLPGNGGVPRQGEYIVTGAQIAYRGDDGTTGTGTFAGGLLYSTRGTVFYPENMGDAEAA